MKVSTQSGPESSVINTLRKSLERLFYAVNDLKQGVYKVSCPKVKTNATFQKPNNIISIDEPTLIEESLNGNRVRALKDDGCNTNFLSDEFFAKMGKNLNWSKCRVEFSHSKKDSVGISLKDILEATLRIEKIRTS